MDAEAADRVVAANESPVVAHLPDLRLPPVQGNALLAERGARSGRAGSQELVAAGGRVGLRQGRLLGASRLLAAG